MSPFTLIPPANLSSIRDVSAGPSLAALQIDYIVNSILVAHDLAVVAAPTAPLAYILDLYDGRTLSPPFSHRALQPPHQQSLESFRPWSLCCQSAHLRWLQQPWQQPDDGWVIGTVDVAVVNARGDAAESTMNLVGVEVEDVFDRHLSCRRNSRHIFGSHVRIGVETVLELLIDSLRCTHTDHGFATPPNCWQVSHSIELLLLERSHTPLDLLLFFDLAYTFW